MKLFHVPDFRLLLLAILFLTGCTTVRQTSRKPTTAPPIPSYGGPKRVVVSLTEQKLRAYDGDLPVFETHVSTGHEPKFTPAGHFRALSKEIIHYSSRYQNSPMPFSVRFHGNYYLHGYYVVPDYPASHGCIRLPLRDANDFNPAQQFYEWVRVGTRVQVTGRWAGPPVAAPVQESRIQGWFKTRPSRASAESDTIYWRP